MYQAEKTLFMQWDGQNGNSVRTTKQKLAQAEKEFQ